MSQEGNTGSTNEFTMAYDHATAGRLPEAEVICRNLLDADPKHADALQLLGGIAQRSGNVDDAVELYSQAIRARPGFAKAHSNLGALLLGQGKTEEASGHFEKAIASEPGFVPAYNNLGNIHVQAERYDDARAVFEKAVAANPEDAIAHNNLGTAFLHLDKFDDAIGHFEKALALVPDLAMAHQNLGACLKRRGDFDAAETCFRRALEHLGGNAPMASFLGREFRSMGLFDDAVKCQSKAIEADGEYHLAHQRRAFVLLAQGRFGEGWKDYLFRRHVRPEAPEVKTDPLPARLDGTHIFLHLSQGLGDEAFFLRFAPELKARGARITYRAGIKVQSIFRRLAFLDEVVGDESVPESGQLSLSVGDLPYLLGMKSEAEIPPSLTFTPLPERLQAIKARLAALGPAPYVGITWRAGTRSVRSSIFKAIGWKHLCPALAKGLGEAFPGTVVALQRKPEDGEIAAVATALGREVHDLSDLNDDLEDMLAALSLIDEYVTVSNTNVHLRAGVGRTTRVLVPNPPEWRWMVEGEESPWFPGSPVYRQGVDGSWDGALARLARDLAAT